MKIKILGTRGEIEPSTPRHKNHSGILIDEKIMFDLGEKKFLACKPRAIFITHLHPDHAFFVRRPITPPSPSYLKRRGNSKISPLKIRGGKEGLWKNFGKIKIFAPEKNENCLQIKIAKRANKILGYKIIAIPTIHSKNVKSAAYLIEKGNKKILYTGDMIWIKKEYWKFLKNLDLVITEGSFMKSGGMIQRDKSGLLWGHQGIPNLIKFFGRFTRRIIITHFGSWFYKNRAETKAALKKMGKDYGVEIISGYDGMKTSI